MLRDVLVDHKVISGIKDTPSLVTGYMDQALSNIPLEQTPFDFVSKFDQNDAQCRSSLASAGITFEMQSRPCKELSLGQKSRMALLGLRFAEPNFYLLDEPTTHVDITGQETLASEIIDRNASCVLVSHDRTFVEEVGTRFQLIEQGKLIECERPESYYETISV